MSDNLRMCCKIRHIVRLRQLLLRWRNRAASSRNTKLAAAPGSGGGSRIPPDVPAGHVALSVGADCRRFVVPATYLNHPLFQKLLVQAEEEYGFAHQGPLAIPCDESVFEAVLRFLSRSDSRNSARFVTLDDFKTSHCCHVDLGGRNWHESRSLLRGFADKSVW